LTARCAGGQSFRVLRLLVPSCLQRFALKPEPRKILKALLRNAFKIFLVVRLIDNCCMKLYAYVQTKEILQSAAF
jgi:hypothetical protein